MPRPPVRHRFSQPGGGEPERLQSDRRGIKPGETGGGRRIAVFRDQKRRLRCARRSAQAGRARPGADEQSRVQRRLVRGGRTLSAARLTRRYRPDALRVRRSTAAFAEHQSHGRHAALGRAFQAWGDRRRYDAPRHVQHGSALGQPQFRAHVRMPRTKGPRGRGAREHRPARSRLRQGHRARHDRATFGAARRHSPDRPDSFCAGDARREPVRVPSVALPPHEIIGPQMSLDDLQAQLRGALDQQFQALKDHYEKAIAEARQQAAAEAHRAGELKVLQARADMEAHVEQIVSSARADTEQRTREAAAIERPAFEHQLRQEFEQHLVERTNAVQGEAERRGREAAMLEWQGREQQLDREFQVQLEHVIASTKRSAELQRESERRKAQNELEAERERARAELEAERVRLNVEIDSARERLEAARDADLARVRQEIEAEGQRARGEWDEQRQRLQAELDAERQRAEGERQRAAERDAEHERERQRAAERDAERERERQRMDAERQQEQQRLAGDRQREQQQLAAERDAERQQARVDFDAELEAVRAEIESELHTARGELAAARSDLQRMRGDLQAERERANAIPGAAAAPMNLDALASAVRDLDDARTLTQVLDALTDHAAAIAGRAAVFVINGDRLRAWKGRGVSDADVRSVESSIGGRDLLARAIQAGRALIVSSEQPAPPFARLAADSPAVAAPIMIGGRAVAVVYADAGGETASGAFEGIELLARHASAVGAVRPATRTLDLRRGVNGGISNGDESGDEPGARRFARLLVAEIKLYNEAAVRAGREQRDLLQRLGTEIDRARRL